MENKRSVVFGVPSLLINFALLILFLLMVLYYYLYGTLPKQKLYIFTVVLIVYIIFTLWRSVILILKDNTLSFYNPLFLKRILKVDISKAVSIKYSKRPGRWSTPSFEVSFVEGEISKFKIVEGSIRAFEVKKLQKLLEGHVSIIMTDW